MVVNSRSYQTSHVKSWSNTWYSSANTCTLRYMTRSSIYTFLIKSNALKSSGKIYMMTIYIHSSSGQLEKYISLILDHPADIKRKENEHPKSCPTRNKITAITICLSNNLANYSGTWVHLIHRTSAFSDFLDWSW